MLPPTLKKPETEAEDLVSAVMCPQCTLFSFNHHNSPNSFQGFFLKPSSFQPPRSCHAAWSAKWPQCFVLKNGTSLSVLTGSVSGSALILKQMLFNATLSPYRVSQHLCHLSGWAIYLYPGTDLFRTAHKQLWDPLGKKAVKSKYRIFAILQLLNQTASIYAHLLRWRPAYYQISPLPLSNPTIKKQL